MGSIAPRNSTFNGQQAITAGTFYGLGGDGSLIHAIQGKWDATFVGVFTFWSCDLPPEEVAVSSVVAGDWIQQQPTTGYAAISPTGAATVGASPLILTVPGGTAGGFSVVVGTFANRRWRIGVVCTVAGQLRIHTSGKI